MNVESQTVSGPHDADQEDTPPDDLNSTSWSSQPVEEKDITLGTKVRKTFPGYGTFDGVVTDLDVHDLPGGIQRFMYLVKYEDGDSEQLYASQLRPLRDHYSKETGGTGGVADAIRATAARVHILGIAQGWHTEPSLREATIEPTIRALSANPITDGAQKASDIREPKNYREACESSFSTAWTGAIKKEVENMRCDSTSGKWSTADHWEGTAPSPRPGSSK